MYGYVLGLEALCRNGKEVLKEYLTDFIWTLATNEESEYHKKIAPIALDAAKNIKMAQLPYAHIPALQLDDRSDFWSKFFQEKTILKMQLDLPPRVEFGEYSRASPTTIIDLQDEYTIQELIELREKIKVLVPTAEKMSGVPQNPLRDWLRPKAKVLAHALAVLISHLDQKDDEIIGHSIPTALALMDAYDDEQRAEYGMKSLLRILTQAKPSQINPKYTQILDIALDRARALSSDTPKNAALFGRLLLRFIALIEEPAKKQHYANQAMNNAIDDLNTWRHPQACIEILRWRLSPTMFLFLSSPNNDFFICSFLSPISPLYISIFKERAPGMAVILALRSLHALTILAWPRFVKNLPLLTALVPAVLLAGAKADDCLRFSTKKQLPKLAPKDEEHARNMLPLAPFVLNHATHYLALLYAISPDLMSTITKRLEAECTSEVVHIIHKAQEEALIHRSSS
uniref:Uncharacterized protein n=1 Tax=Aureoumbra lagunensis TaxID=44058 RepID=A0A7S3NRK2_9STRA